MRVLITGAAGQLGQALQAVFAGHDVVAAGRRDLDVGDRDAVWSAVCGLAPEAIVHAAAWTAVDACENDPDRAWRDNALACRHVTQAAAHVGAFVCGVSTDYVFDGTATAPYTEWDQPRPLNMYGRSKLGGEREFGPAAAVVRTSWLCGLGGANFVATMVRLAGGDQPEVKVVDDQHGCPTFTPDLAAVIHRLTVGRMAGLFHVTNQGPTTWYQLARDVFRLAGADPDRVVPIATSELDPPRAATRPMRSVLDNAALRLMGLPLPAEHHDPLERLVKELVA